MGAKGGGGGKSTIGTSGIPPESRKMVLSLKEIVNNCTELEIYATLRECNMDPDEAVNRLLTQDPFHEVKSKREKKKETKDPTDSRSRSLNVPSSRTSKGGADRYSGRGSMNQFGYSDSGVMHSKPAYKKENGANDYAGSSSSASGQSGNHTFYQYPSHSSSGATENKISVLGAGDGTISSSQSSYGYQSAWLGSQGQVSMADIVKMGKPQGKNSSVQNTSLHGTSVHNVPFQGASSYQNFNSAQHPSSTATELHTAPGISSQHGSLNDEWPSIEPPQAVNISSAIESPAVSELYSNPVNVSLDGAIQHINQDKVQGVEAGSVDTVDANHAAHVSALSRSLQEEDNSGIASVSDSDLYDDMSSYLPHGHAIENNEAEDGVSSMSANFQQLSLQNEEQASPPEEDNSSVVIPHHLQLHTPDCFHLSFGSFGAGNNASFPGSGSFPNRLAKSNLEETSASADVSPVGHSEARNPEYFEDDGTNPDANLIHRSSASAGYYETPDTQAEVKQETSENSQANVYAFPSSGPAFSYESNQPSDIAFIQNSSEMQNLERAMLAYTNTLSNNMLLASTVQTAREDPPYSPFPDTQTMPKYSNVASSITGPSISMPEVLRTGSISTSQPTQSNVAAGPALPQHLPVHPYSQPSLPLGHFANMIGYPFLPQSYTYMPSGFQQAFAGNSTYHQALAAVLPQYKNSISVSSLPQSAAIPSGYGFGSSTSIPGGNFPLNPPTAPAGSTISYEDAISSQYKENNHLLSLQQNENPAMWIHGPGSRTMSAVPANAYYSLQGQNQQTSGFRQGQQQPSQQFGALGYPNYYHSQTGLSLDGQQQQNIRDASHGGSQGQPPKQSQQIWQNSY